MYRFRKAQVLDPAFLTKLIERFKKEYVPRFVEDQNYYEVKTKILQRVVEDGKPNNRLAHGFARYITNMATSYFMGKPIRYQIDQDEDGRYQEALQEVFDDNYIDSLNFEASKEASKKGIGYLLLFLNESGKLRIKRLETESVIPVYSPSLDEFLEAAVRIWSEHDIEGTLLCEYADVYDSEYIYHFSRENGANDYAPCKDNDKEAHKMSDLPVIAIWNNEEQMGDFEPHISLFDAYDRGRSDTSNDMDYFTDAYLAISGASEVLAAGLTAEDDSEGDRTVKNLRQNRILLLDEKGQAQWLIKNVNDTATEHHMSRLYKDIFFLAQVPALSDESFAGNLSGIAIKYKLIGLEELSIMKENQFRSAQKKMLQIITDYINTKYNQKWDADQVTLKFERNFIDNLADIIDNVKNLEGIVSRETQLDMLPGSIVDDTAQELEKIQAEAVAAEELPLAVVER